ncbi:MAG: hypothetical protein QGH97_08380 [Dehalococcoidia bacterium]|jgi:hypothetical protein|nr:hypothetical protein [Dehalococcoidia bacterium]
MFRVPLGFACGAMAVGAGVEVGTAVAAGAVAAPGPAGAVVATGAAIPAGTMVAAGAAIPAGTMVAAGAAVAAGLGVLVGWGVAVADAPQARTNTSLNMNWRVSSLIAWRSARPIVRLASAVFSSS